MTLLVSTETLAAELGDPRVRLLDATYFALEPERDAVAHFRAGHLPGACFLDLEHLADPSTDLPFMLPPAKMLADRLGELGLRRGDRIVLYDDAPHKTAARAWWMLRTIGLRDITLLDGGFAKWVAEGRPVERGDPGPVDQTSFDASSAPASAPIKADMRRLVAGGDVQIVDARSRLRFTGAEPDPRPGVAPGHIPGSLNLPYGQLFNADGTWKQAGDLRDAFVEAGIDLERPIVTTCGSGVTAAILLFGLALLGKRDVALYDGSWSEWGADPSLPKALGA